MKKKKTTYAIIGLIASGFLILPVIMLITKATGKPYEYGSSPVIEYSEDIEIIETDTIPMPVATESHD